MYQYFPTIFHITHWKAGSQWIFQLLESWQPQRIITPLVDNRQFKGQPILPGMIYPTLYITRDEFEAASVPEPHVKFVVIRDIRDTLISEYFSVHYSHMNMYDPHESRTRSMLNAHSLEEGLRFEMHRFLPGVSAIQRSWIHSGNTLFRYEDFLQNEQEQFRRLFELCQVELDRRHLQKLVEAFSFERRTGRSKGIQDIHSHYRNGIAGDWQNYLRGALLAEFKERYDEVLIETGYEANRDWGLSDIPRSYSIAARRGVNEGSQARRQCWCSSKNLIPFSPEYDKCLECGSLVCNNLTGNQVGKDDVTPQGSATWSHYSPYGVGIDTHERTRYQFSNSVILNTLQTVLKYKVAGSRVLDVGCGLGAFVALAGQAGFDAIGLDPSQYAVEFARQTFNIPVRHGTIEDQAGALGTFDVIVLMNTVERFPDPLGTLAQCSRLLAEDGLLVIIGKQFDDTRTYAEWLSTGSTMLRLLYPREFTYLFTPSSFRSLLTRAGYEWIEVDSSDVTVAGRREIPEIQERIRWNSADGFMTQALLDLNADLQVTQQRLIEDNKLAMRQLQRIMSPSPSLVLQHDVLFTGQGWYPLETYQGETFCWIENDAELIIQSPSGKVKTLALEIEPGPGLNCAPFELLVLNQTRETLAAVAVRGRETIALDLPLVADKEVRFRLHVKGGGLPTPNDPRILNFRIFRFGWN